MTARGLFQVAGALVLLVVLVLLVIQPAIARGGAGELLIVAGILVAILVIERWLRTR